MVLDIHPYARLFLLIHVYAAHARNRHACIEPLHVHHAWLCVQKCPCNDVYMTGNAIHCALRGCANPLCVVVTYSWCGPCKLLEPILLEALNAQDADGKMVVVGVDVDTAGDIAEVRCAGMCGCCIRTKAHKSNLNVVTSGKKNSFAMTRFLTRFTFARRCGYDGFGNGVTVMV